MQKKFFWTGDHGGYVKYWQSNMNNVKMFQAHKEAVRSVSFAPTDQVLNQNWNKTIMG